MGRGDGGVYRRRGTKFWWIRYTVEGKEFYESSKSESKTEAKRLLRKRLQEAEVLGAPKPYTVKELVDDYVKAARGRLSYSSWVMARRRGDIVIEGLGKMKARDLKTLHIKRWRDELEDAFARTTVNHIMSTLRQALHQATMEGTLAHMPTFPRRLPPGLPRQGFLEKSDYAAIHSALEPWAADVLEFSYHTGWRRNECLYLEWSEVDLRASMIRLSPRRSKNRLGRDRPIFGDLRPLIERRHAERVLNLSYVFHKDGKKIGLTSFWREWRRACEAAGRDGVHFHDLRRTAARNFDRAGLRRDVAMRLLGHKTDAMYRRYNIIDERDLVEGAGKLEEFFEQEDGPRVVPFKRKDGEG